MWKVHRNTRRDTDREIYPFLHFSETTFSLLESCVRQTYIHIMDFSLTFPSIIVVSILNSTSLSKDGHLYQLVVTYIGLSEINQEL